MTVRDWDAASYDRVSNPQVEMAVAVLERLPLRGDETVHIDTRRSLVSAQTG